MARLMHKSARTGRKDATERIRELVSLLGSLSKTGDTVTIEAISSRMGLSLEEAQSMMNIVCTASGEESLGLLISSNDDETEFVLQYPGVHGKPLRLTSAETIALIHGLDLVGIDEGDPIRERLRSSFTAPNIVEGEVRQALGKIDESDASALSETLRLCATAQASQCELLFSYQGIKDTQPRPRALEVEKVWSDDARWYVRGRDLTIAQDRTFRIDRMSDVRLGENVQEQRPQAESASGTSTTQERKVSVTFSDPRYVTLFEWPGLVVTQRSENVVRGTLPYYGPSSTWLIRRIVACNQTLVVDDDQIMQAAHDYAAALL